MTKRTSRLLFLSPPPGSSSGGVGAEARRSVDIRLTRSYLLVPIRQTWAVDVVSPDEIREVQGWQHLNVPGDLRIHVTRERPKGREILTAPLSNLPEWRTLATVTSEPATDTPVLFPGPGTTQLGPGVLIIAPDLPDLDTEWRFVVELLAGPSTDADYPEPSLADLEPVPMNGGHVVWRVPIASLLPKARHPAAADLALRGWWAPGPRRSGITVWT